MPKIGEVAKFVRSKNAGPFWIAMDIFTNNKEDLLKIANSKNLTKARIAEVYGVEEKNVKIFRMDDLNVIKVSVPRVLPQGDKYERDMHAGQQFVQLAELEI